MAAADVAAAAEPEPWDAEAASPMSSTMAIAGGGGGGTEHAPHAAHAPAQPHLARQACRDEAHHTQQPAGQRG